jgi:hypothetical protein
MGFGSLGVFNQENTIEIAIEALKTLNLRGIYCTGWGVLDQAFLDKKKAENPDRIHFIKYPCYTVDLVFCLLTWICSS